MRGEKVEHLVITSMIDKKYGGGRQREKTTEGMAQCLHSANVVEILKTTKEKELWRKMIPNTNSNGTT